MSEVVTVQVGSFANYIGSHFWNFQDELLGLAEDQHADPVYRSPSLNMDVLYRAGETHQVREDLRIPLACCPSVLKVEFLDTNEPFLIHIVLHGPTIMPTTPSDLVGALLLGSLGSLHSSSSLYGDPLVSDPRIFTWDGKVTTTHVAEPHRKNLFLRSLDEQHEQPHGSESGPIYDGEGQVSEKDMVECLEDNVHYWTDFAKVHYHPRSLYELRCSWIDIHDFDNYGIGRDAFRDGLQGGEMIDRLRLFVEECDHIQGFQFIVDDSGGFSSVAADLLDTVADDYGKTPVLLYSAKNPVSYTNTASRKQTMSRALHDAISFSRLSSSCKLMVPVGLPSLSKSKLSALLNINDAKLFHSSAVFSAGIHSISLPFRMESPQPTTSSNDVCGAVNIHELVQLLAEQNRQNMAIIMDIAMPAPPLNVDQPHGHLQRSLHSLTPEIAEDAEDIRAVESVVVHGALHSGGRRASVSEVQDAFCKGYQNGCPRPMFSRLSAAACPLPVPLPFPSIFGSLVGQHGELGACTAEGVHSKGPLEVNSIPMAARLRSSSAILPFLEKRLENLRRYGIQRGACGGQILSSWGFSKDEVEDMGETLSKMVTALDPRPEMSSDSD